MLRPASPPESSLRPALRPGSSSLCEGPQTSPPRGAMAASFGLPPSSPNKPKSAVKIQTREASLQAREILPNLVHSLPHLAGFQSSSVDFHPPDQQSLIESRPDGASSLQNYLENSKSPRADCGDLGRASLLGPAPCQPNSQPTSNFLAQPNSFLAQSSTNPTQPSLHMGHDTQPRNHSPSKPGCAQGPNTHFFKRKKRARFAATIGPRRPKHPAAHPLTPHFSGPAPTLNQSGPSLSSGPSAAAQHPPPLSLTQPQVTPGQPTLAGQLTSALTQKPLQASKPAVDPPRFPNQPISDPGRPMPTFVQILARPPGSSSSPPDAVFSEKTYNFDTTKGSPIDPNAAPKQPFFQTKSYSFDTTKLNGVWRVFG